MFQFIKYQQQIIWDSADSFPSSVWQEEAVKKIWFQTQDKDTKI